MKLPGRIIGSAIGLALFVVVGFDAVAWGQLAIQPAFVEVDLSDGRPSGRFVVTNGLDAEQRFRIRARYFEYSVGGALTFPPEGGERSLAEWVRFNPTEFTMPPRSRRVIRFIILPRGRLEQGEYWGAMSLDALDPREQEMDLGDDRKLNLTVMASLLVPIFGHQGEIRYAAAVSDVQLQPTPRGPGVAALIDNKGDGRLFVKGSFKLIDGGGQTVAEGGLGGGYVMSGAKRRFAALVGKALPPGDYRVSLSFDAGREGLQLTADERLTLAPMPAAEPGEGGADDPGADDAGSAPADDHAGEPDTGDQDDGEASPS